MMRARVAFAGSIYEAAPRRRGAQAPPDDTAEIELADGRVLREDQVVWLPPFETGTVIALGLNYADHAKELAFGSQQEPLIFLKGPGALLGHRGATSRPPDVEFMHYECELAVVIGRPAKHVSRSEALRHVAGYCIANDYAVRDYLENWYRPNARAKNRDGATVLGPWLVDAADVDSSNLNLSTFVNGRKVQSGNTRDFIFDIPHLIEYLSSFMSLSPGDVILTGTPEGVQNVIPGDDIVCRIEGLGWLRNTIVAEPGRGPASGESREG